MPITLDIDKAAGRITATVEGRMAFDDLRATLSHLVGHHDFDSRMDRLWDLREARAFVLTDKMKTHVRAVRELLGGRRAAVIAPQNDTTLQPLYPLFVESESQVFRDRDAALDWLERNRREQPSAGYPCAVSEGGGNAPSGGLQHTVRNIWGRGE